MYALNASLVEVALGLSVAEVVDEDDAGDVVVEDVARVAVRLRPAHVEQLWMQDGEEERNVIKILPERGTSQCVRHED